MRRRYLEAITTMVGHNGNDYSWTAPQWRIMEREDEEAQRERSLQVAAAAMLAKP